MKQKIYAITVALCLFSGILFNACVKDTTTDLNYGIEPSTQKSLLCKSLRLIGNNHNGAMPVGIGTGFPITVSTPTAIEISSGVLLLLPYTVSDPSKICKIYLQVEGADNYWETKLVLAPVSKRPYFSILIPKFVHNGTFNFIFSLADCNGNLSRTYSTKTIVSPVSDCTTSIEGAYGITIRAFDLGNKAGSVCFAYDMFQIPDRLDIRYNGKWVASTGRLLDNTIVIPDCNISGGFVSGTGKLCFNYDPNISRFAEVYISGCNVGTAWELRPNCP